MIDLFSD